MFMIWHTIGDIVGYQKIKLRTVWLFTHTHTHSTISKGRRKIGVEVYHTEISAKITLALIEFNLHFTMSIAKL